MSADAVSDRFTDCDICHSRKKQFFDAVVPSYFAASASEPGLVHNQGRLFQEQSGNQTSQADVVLKKKIAPPEQSKKLDDGRLTSDTVRTVFSSTFGVGC